LSIIKRLQSRQIQEKIFKSTDIDKRYSTKVKVLKVFAGKTLQKYDNTCHCSFTEKIIG